VVRNGVRERVFKILAEKTDNEYAMISAIIIRAHQHSAGAAKKSRRQCVIAGNIGRYSNMGI